MVFLIFVKLFNNDEIHFNLIELMTSSMLVLVLQSLKAYNADEEGKIVVKGGHHRLPYSNKV